MNNLYKSFWVFPFLIFSLSLFAQAPQITILNPNSGSANNTIQIQGQNFDTTGSVVNFGSVSATINSITSTTIEAVVPNLGTTNQASSVTVITSQGTSNAVLFSYLAPPIITSITPSSGVPVTALEITGENFSVTSGTTQVYFDSIPGLYVYVTSPTKLSVTVPDLPQIKTYSVFVQTNGGISQPGSFVYNGPAFSPYLTSISPDQAGKGATIEILGDQFASSPPVVNFTLNFDTITVAPFFITNNALNVVVPDLGDENTDYSVTVTSDLGTSNNLVLHYAAAPTITALTPNNAFANTYIQIQGKNFTDISTVNFGSSPVTAIFRSENILSVLVPPGSGVVPVSVTTPGGTTQSLNFTYEESSNFSLKRAKPKIINGSLTLMIKGRNLNKAKLIFFSFNGKLVKIPINSFKQNENQTLFGCVPCDPFKQNENQTFFGSVPCRVMGDAQVFLEDKKGRTSNSVPLENLLPLRNNCQRTIK